MNENNAPERAARTMKPKIYRVEDSNTGFGGYYYATSTTQAKAMHTESLEARLATELEIMEIGRRGLAVVNLTPGDDEPDNQVGAFSRHQMEAPSSED